MQLFGGNADRLERELERMAPRKFKFVVSMQWYSNFNPVECENAEFLLHAYPIYMFSLTLLRVRLNFCLTWVLCKKWLRTHV